MFKKSKSPVTGDLLRKEWLMVDKGSLTREVLY